MLWAIGRADGIIHADAYMFKINKLERGERLAALSGRSRTFPVPSRQAVAELYGPGTAA
jgi:hypothetical protein